MTWVHPPLQLEAPARQMKTLQHYTSHRPDQAQRLVQLVDELSEPECLADTIVLVEVAAHLVETAAFEAAESIHESQVVDLINLAAQLEAYAAKLSGTKLS